MAKIKMIAFMTIALSIFIGIHLLAYFSLLSFFSVKSHAIRGILKVIIILLTSGFFFGFIVSRNWTGALADLYYGLSAVWIGFLINFTIFMAVGWIFVWLFRLVGVETRTAIGSAVLLCTAVFTAYGVFMAFDPKIENVSVGIKGLPDSWKGKTVIQISDLHLGKINRVAFAEKIVGEVNSLHPYIIFITGDLFDGMGSDPEGFIRAIDKLEAEKGVYFVSGNHEAYLGKDKVLKLLSKSKLNILENRLIAVDGVQIVGIGYPDFGKGFDDPDMIKKMPGYDPSLPSILLHHLPTSVEQKNEGRSTQQSNTYWSPDTDFTIAKNSGINLQLSGHSHAGQVFPFEYLSRLIYKGYDYGLHTDGDFNIYTSSGTGTWGPPLRTAKRGEIVKLDLVNKP